jgi:hypothetical protein
MTWRSVLIGIIGGLLIGGLGYVNDRVLMLESVNNGHQLPIIVISLLLIAVVAINPLLAKVRESWPLKPAELGVITAILMVCCSISGRGLMEHFIHNMVLPHHWMSLEPGWQKQKLLDYVPEEALVDAYDEAGYREAVGPFLGGMERKELQGMSTTQSMVQGVKDVPWHRWANPLRTWLPLVFVLAICVTALTLVVHHQWSKHELLSYPIAEFTASLIKPDAGSGGKSLFRSNLFWIGFGIIFLIRVNNGLSVWFPNATVAVPLNWEIEGIRELFPVLGKVSWGWAITGIRVFPLVIAFCFFLRSEVSLSLGIAPVLWVLVAGPMVYYGIELNTDYEIGGWEGWNRFGGYVAFGIMILYFGRNFYLKLVRQAFFFGGKDERVPCVWAFRIFVLSAITLIILTCNLGLAWPLATILVGLMLLTFLVVSRISAETGLFFIQPAWQPSAMMVALFGSYALGPAAIVIASMFCGMLCIDQSQAMMPYLVNALKICEKVKVKVSSFSMLSLGTYTVGVLLAVVVVLGVSYRKGATNYFWSFHRGPTMPLRAVSGEAMELEAKEQLTASQQLTVIERFTNIHPKPSFLWAAGTGFFLVLLFTFLRLRLPKFPLHPVIFLIWATFPIAVLGQSFLWGWILKALVSRYGGNQTVQRMKPLMIGVIAAEIIGAVVFVIVGAIYYMNTGSAPVSYRYFPR